MVAHFYAFLSEIIKGPRYRFHKFTLIDYQICLENLSFPTSFGRYFSRMNKHDKGGCMTREDV